MVMRRRSKRRPMNASSKADSEPCLPCACLHPQNCWQYTCDLLSRAWEVSVGFVADSWDYISQKLNCCNRETESEIREASSMSSEKRDQHKVPSKESIKDQTTKPMSPGAAQRNGSLGSPSSATNSHQHTTKPSSPSQTISSTQTTVMSQPLTTDSPTSPPRRNSSPSAERSHSQPTLSQGAPSEPTVRSSLTGPSSQTTKMPHHEIEMPQPEPPKIDFIETGSIFGDRKKPTIDQSMFQMENGRFRSPGQSKVIQGPGGRTIRVSFVSGFPSTKSIDSHRSATQTQGARLSRKSVESGSGAKEKGGLESGGSKMKKISSSKSLKSNLSKDSTDTNQDNNDRVDK